MKNFIVFIIGFLFLSHIGVSQNEINVFPYKGGEKVFKEEFSQYLSKHIKINDSSGIYFVEIGYLKDKQVGVEINGTGKNDSLTKIIEDFFKSASNNWDRGALKKRGLIVPIFIMTYCGLEKNGDINWANLISSKMPETKDALFVSPVIAAYMCPGEPDGDKLEIKGKWVSKIDKHHSGAKKHEGTEVPAIEKKEEAHH